MTDSLLKHALRSHPASPAPPGLRVEVERLPADDADRPLRLRFSLLGPLGAVRLPAELGAEERVRTDGLWQHTCFEAFLGAPGAGVPYVEYNLAPSGAWASYRFDRYRAGMRAEPLAAAPRMATHRAPERLVLEVALPWPQPWPGTAALPTATARRGRLGLSAVIEVADGSLSYWALHHPAARADFHNDGGFTLGLEVPA